MNTESLHKRLTPMEYAALFDAAKVRALELRSEAIRDFWLAAAGGVGCAWHAIWRDRPTPGISRKRAA
jgi:hypothetical protein